jgi:hypothetical protein
MPVDQEDTTMKGVLKKTISAALLALGLASLTGCYYYDHDRDWAYREPDWNYHGNWDGHWHDGDWHDRFAYGPRHWDRD